MAERSSSLTSWLSENIAIVVVVATLGANIVAQWAVINDRVDDIEHNRDIIATLGNRLSVLEVRYEALRDVVLELRRQSALTDPSPLR